MTRYITGDPHEYDRVALPEEQDDVRTTYIITGDPHNSGQPERLTVVERRVVAMPYLSGDPHYRDLLLASE